MLLLLFNQARTLTVGGAAASGSAAAVLGNVAPPTPPGASGGRPRAGNSVWIPRRPVIPEPQYALTVTATAAAARGSGMLRGIPPAFVIAFATAQSGQAGADLGFTEPDEEALLLAAVAAFD